MCNPVALNRALKEEFKLEVNGTLPSRERALGDYLFQVLLGGVATEPESRGRNLLVVPFLMGR